MLAMPTVGEMYRALCNRDAEYEGQFFVGVRTTGIFCRPTCPARKPKRENIDFYRSSRDALAAGFRPCKRCRPMDAFGTAPDWLDPLLTLVETDTSKRWTDADLRQLAIPPSRVRRWFKQHHGMTFHMYQRTRRLAGAMQQIHTGQQNTTVAAFDGGYESLSGFRDAFQKWSGAPPSQCVSGRSPILLTRLLSPLGPLVAGAVDGQVCLLEFADRRMLETQLQRIQKHFQTVFAPGTDSVLEQLDEQLQSYFAGQRADFDLPLDLKGTDFQRAVWQRLQEIPHGETLSYERLAREIGRPGAQRAVGRANGDNRLAIIIPCHRVIRSDGTLSGYGGGLWRKEWLLDHERKHPSSLAVSSGTNHGSNSNPRQIANITPSRSNTSHPAP